MIDGDNNLEIEEFKQIYKYWYNKHNCANSIKEKNILNIISHFYPNIIIDNKFLEISYNTSLWLNGRALDYESRGCRFESCQGCFFILNKITLTIY